MKPRLILVGALLLAALSVGGYLLYQNGLVAVPLADGVGLFVPAKPEYGEDQARVEAVMPPSLNMEAFLANQSALPLIREQQPGVWTGVLAQELELSRNGRRLRFRVHQGWRLHDGGELDASRIKAFWAPLEEKLGFQAKAIAGHSVEVRFTERPGNALVWLARWLVPGTGPFRQQGTTLTRFDGFIHGKAGLAELRIQTDPALMESRAWAAGLASGAWAWAVFPGKIAPEDMAKVRLAPYDEFRMKDGSVWFLSRRLRRLRPDQGDWTRTRIFGAWKGAMDLPYDPLGM